MRKQNVVAAGILAGLLTLAPAAVPAGQLAYGGPATSPPGDPNPLEIQAREMLSTPGKFGQAAKLLLKAAGQREAGDPLRVADIALAARLTYYRGDVPRARVLMERAAHEARDAGDVLMAAHTYMDAAFIAIAEQSPEDVHRLVRNARLLASSPLLAQQDRQQILSRLPAGE